MTDARPTIDAMEDIVRPIVEGQIRGFLKEHPSIVAAVDWYKPRKDKAITFTNSLAKRIVNDLLSVHSRTRMRAALLEVRLDSPPLSAVASGHCGEPGALGTITERAVAPSESQPPLSDEVRADLARIAENPTPAGQLHDDRMDSARRYLASACEARGWEPDKLQWKWRNDPPAYPTKPEDIGAWNDECLWAIIDALVTQGSIIAWPGDGTSCVQQMVAHWAQRTASRDATIAGLTAELAGKDATMQPRNVTDSQDCRASLCDGGVDISALGWDDACPKCGATMDDTCGFITPSPAAEGK